MLANGRNNLRPTSLAEFIGNENIKETLRIQLSAAQKKSKQLPHMLFEGWSGCGKTTLAQCVANAVGGKFHSLNATTITHAKQLLKVLGAIQAKDIIFIDEIHRLLPDLQEFLYTAMEDYKLVVARKKGGDTSEFSTLEIEPFTLIGATTDMGLLNSPFLNRFETHHHLEPYSSADLFKIVKINAAKCQLVITDDGIKEIAKRSKGVPRNANSLLNWISDFATDGNLPRIDKDLAIKAMNHIGIDPLGLNENDKKYLKALSSTPTGLGTICARTGLTEESVKRFIEPFLISIGMVKIESRGRIAASSEALTYSERDDDMFDPHIFDNMDLTGI